MSLRRIVALVATAVLLTASACARRSIDVTPADPPLATIVTWNLNAGAGNLEALLVDLQQDRLTRPGPTDTVVLLQEAIIEEHRQLQRLADIRGWSIVLVPVRFDGRRTRGNAILASRPLESPRAIPLPQERQTRNAAAASVWFGNQRLFVVSTQLENRLAGFRGLLSDTARARQALALLDALPADAPGIVGGDLNTWMGRSEPALRTFARRFSDTPALRPDATFRGGVPLDHLFLDLPDGWRAVARVETERYGSDHHPVVAEIFGS